MGVTTVTMWRSNFGCIVDVLFLSKGDCYLIPKGHNHGAATIMVHRVHQKGSSIYIANNDFIIYSQKFEILSHAEIWTAGDEVISPVLGIHETLTS